MSLYPILIAICGGACLFFVLYGLLFCLTGKKREVQSRISEIQHEKTDPPTPKKAAKKQRVKKQNTIATKTKKQLEKLENQLYDAGIRIPVEQFMLLWIGATILLPTIASVLGLGFLVSIVVAVACAAAPILLLNVWKKKRCKQLDDQLVEAISILCNALRAGHSFQSAMQNISREMTGVVAEEFGRVFRETQHGMTMEESMNRMVERTGSEDLNMLCTAVLIQREVGGNLAEVLENISGTIQARLSLKAEIKTRTSSGRLSAYLIGALPIVLLIAISVLNPGYAEPLFQTKTGHIMLIIGGVMEAIGFIVIMKITDIKY